MAQHICNYTLSIITVTYNAESELRKTIESILSQEKIDGVKIEYIIQDGLSKDGTLSVASAYRDSLKKKGIAFRVYSEKDSGIYDAMNQGIRRATGKWICLLNAGDTFFDQNSINNVKTYLEQSTSDVLYADYCRINPYIKTMVKIPEMKELRKTMIFCHQAIFVRDYIYFKDMYDCRYKLVADYELMLRLYLRGYAFMHIPVCLIAYDTDGISAKSMIQTYREIFKIRREKNVIDNIILEYCSFSVGIGKRFILANMPQRLRWHIFKVLKGPVYESKN